MVIRDLILLIGGGYILKRYQVRVPVIYAGKVATTFLYIGFVGVLLNFPLFAGLGVCDFSWLPGFSAAQYSWGFWFVYAGLILNIFTTSYYLYAGIKGARSAKARELAQASSESAHG